MLSLTGFIGYLLVKEAVNLATIVFSSANDSSLVADLVYRVAATSGGRESFRQISLKRRFKRLRSVAFLDTLTPTTTRKPGRLAGYQYFKVSAG